MAAKKQKKELILPILPLVNDDSEVLERLKVMVESLLYHYYLNTFDGDIVRVYAFVSPTGEMNEKANDVPEYKEYVKEVKESKKKYAIDFELILDQKDKGEDYDL